MKELEIALKESLPSKPGLYFAKSRKEMQWFDYIVEVLGEAPMLYISYVLDRGINGPLILHLKPFEIAGWGSQID